MWPAEQKFRMVADTEAIVSFISLEEKAEILKLTKLLNDNMQNQINADLTTFTKEEDVISPVTWKLYKAHGRAPPDVVAKVKRALDAQHDNLKEAIKKNHQIDARHMSTCINVYKSARIASDVMTHSRVPETTLDAIAHCLRQVRTFLFFAKMHEFNDDVNDDDVRKLAAFAANAQDKPIGTNVTVHSIQSKPELNDKRGTIVEKTNGRYAVRIDAKKPMLLASKNLEWDSAEVAPGRIKEYSVGVIWLIMNAPRMNLQRVYVAHSPKGGSQSRGVFAKRSLVAGEIATFYPADVCAPASEKSAMMYVFSDRCTPGFQDTVKRDYAALREYMQSFGEWAIAGDPALDKDPDRVGHLLNDPVGPRNLQSHAMLQESESKAREQANVKLIHIGLHLAVVVTKPIGKAEELLYNYGTEYWTEAS
tara:strand:- start:202 stop:1464 length:1263 start_codon:yes stop_codon:yes gene_type:complete